MLRPSIDLARDPAAQTVGEGDGHGFAGSRTGPHPRLEKWAGLCRAGSLKRGTRIERVPALERGEVPALLRAPRRQRQKDRPRAPAEMLSELG
jgi:hypothetical protein